MVTLTKYGAKYNRNILFLEGLSTDTKPTDEFDGLSIQNGSEYTEVDTGKKFLFDYDNATWYEVQTGGGGGGGGGTSNYNDLSNRPSVNNTVLTGNKTSAQLGLASSEQGGKADSAIQGVKLNGGSVITPDANNIVDITVGKADVGLGNVTNDAQVKKISSSTSGDIVTWSGTSGDTVADSGVSIETSITDSDLKIPTSKAVETALADKADKDNVYKLALSNADLLPANTDLDDVKTVGCYYVLASAIVPTITHRPTENASAFRVTVELAAGTIRPRQIYQEYNSYDKYIRTENSSGVFGGWKKVEGDLSTIYTKTEVDTALSDKVDKETGKGLSTNDYTTAEKTKLAGIEAQANKTTVDDTLSGSSTNPVQNKVVKTALDGKANTSTTYTKTEVDTALSGKQDTIDSSHKLSADLVNDTSTTNKFATAAELEQIETNKNNILTVANYGGGINKLNPVPMFTSGQYAVYNATTNTYGETAGHLDTYSNLRFMIQACTGTTASDFTVVSTLVNSNITQNGTPAWLFTKLSTFNRLYVGHNGSQTDCKFFFDVSNLEDNQKYYLCVNITNYTHANNEPFTWKNVMVLSEEDYLSGLWQVYQPYAMSNAELTVKEQANENNISSVVDWLNTVGNLSPLYSATSEAQTFIVFDTPITLEAGTYNISWQTTATTGSTAVSLFNGSTRIFNETVSNDSVTSVSATISSAADKFNIYTNVANTLYDIKIIKQ